MSNEVHGNKHNGNNSQWVWFLETYSSETWCLSLRCFSLARGVKCGGGRCDVVSDGGFVAETEALCLPLVHKHVG